MDTEVAGWVLPMSADGVEAGVGRPQSGARRGATQSSTVPEVGRSVEMMEGMAASRARRGMRLDAELLLPSTCRTCLPALR
jgi:hypothetical protein